MIKKEILLYGKRAVQRIWNTKYSICGKFLEIINNVNEFKIYVNFMRLTFRLKWQK